MKKNFIFKFLFLCHWNKSTNINANFYINYSVSRKEKSKKSSKLLKSKKSKCIFAMMIICSLGIIGISLFDYFAHEHKGIYGLLIGFVLLILNIIILCTKCCHKVCLFMLAGLLNGLLGIFILLEGLLNLLFLNIFSMMLFNLITGGLIILNGLSYMLLGCLQKNTCKKMFPCLKKSKNSSDDNSSDSEESDDGNSDDGRQRL